MLSVYCYMLLLKVTNKWQINVLSNFNFDFFIYSTASFLYHKCYANELPEFICCHLLIWTADIYCCGELYHRRSQQQWLIKPCNTPMKSFSQQCFPMTLYLKCIVFKNILWLVLTYLTIVVFQFLCFEITRLITYFYNHF